MAVGFLIPMYFVVLKKSVCFSSPMEAKYLLKSSIFHIRFCESSNFRLEQCLPSDLGRVWIVVGFSLVKGLTKYQFLALPARWLPRDRT